jgi:hypothetical protein
MATVVIVESHAAYDVNANDPLSLDTEPDVRLINFTSLESWAKNVKLRILDTTPRKAKPVSIWNHAVVGR